MHMNMNMDNIKVLQSIFWCASTFMWAITHCSISLFDCCSSSSWCTSKALNRKEYYFIALVSTRRSPSLRETLKHNHKPPPTSCILSSLSLLLLLHCEVFSPSQTGFWNNPNPVFLKCLCSITQLWYPLCELSPDPSHAFNRAAD